MEPKPSTPHPGLERLSNETSQRVERSAYSSPERKVERFVESVEKPQSESTVANQVALPVLPSPTVMPAVSDDIAGGAASDVPLVANDDDLIEKEWVEKAKKIIAETKDDPYRREQEVGRLQAEYLRKRYGKELGASK